MTISVCIPTYNRLNHFSQAIESCLFQTKKPDEILIGDDSNNNETEKFINEIFQTTNINIKYFKNQPSLKQAKNVNMLFSKVATDLTVLLHDDDVLLLDCIEKLSQCFINNPEVDVAFGKQYLMSEDGIINEDKSEKLNDCFYRTSTYTKTKLSSLESGFLQQIPNDCYMLRSNVLKNSYYNEKMGDACDFDFGLQLGLQNYKMYFLNEYTSKYRISDLSVSNKKDYNGGFMSYKLVEQLKVPKQTNKLKEKWLKLKAPVAIAQACNLNFAKEACRIYFGKWHRKKILSLGGVKRFLLIIRTLVNSKMVSKN